MPRAGQKGIGYAIMDLLYNEEQTGMLIDEWAHPIAAAELNLAQWHPAHLVSGWTPGEPAGCPVSQWALSLWW